MDDMTIAQPDASVDTGSQVEGTESTIEQTPTEPFLKVKYLKEEKGLSREEAAKYAQLGMNEERFKDKYEQSKQYAEFVERLSTDYGMTPSEYMEAVAKQKVQSEIDKIAAEKNVDDEVAKELYDAIKLKERYQEESVTKKEEDRRTKEFSEFAKENPTVSPDDIPEEVFIEFTNGKSLIDAYAKYENKQLKTKMSELEKALNIKSNNDKNASASTGSVSDKTNIEQEYYTFEQVQNMSPKDQRLNADKIKKSMTKWQ